MGNIWLVLIPSFFAYGCFVGTIIFQLAKKPDYYLLKIIFCIACILVLLVFDIPNIKDLVEKETTVVVAEYIDFQSSNTMPGTRKLFFNANGKQFALYVPMYTRDVAKLQPGEIYEIEFFNNSKVIKSYKPIE